MRRFTVLKTREGYAVRTQEALTRGQLRSTGLFRFHVR